MTQSLVIIGAGVMGDAYGRAVTGTNLRYRVRVAGVCDVREDAARSLADRCGAPAFTALDEMLDTVAADAAYIAAPDHLHEEPFLACVRRGVPVLVEKPLAVAPSTAAAMRQAARDAGVYAECNFSNRSNPVFTRVRAAIEAGEVGEVLGVNARLSNVISYPTRHLRWAAETTAAWFLLSHVFDLTTWLTGARATRVSATGVRKVLPALGVDTYDLIHAMVGYDNGLSGIYESSWSLPDSLPSPVDFGYSVLGSEGVVHVDTSDQMVHIAGAGGYTHPGVLDWTEARLTQFLDNLAAADPAADPLADAVSNTLLLDALHRSLATGAPLEVATASEGGER